MSQLRDLRPRFFAGLEWYDSLVEPTEPGPSAWYSAKDPAPEWPVETLNAALAFADRHSLQLSYRRRFAGISPQDLLPARALAEFRSVSAPIWEIANELLVGAILENVQGWTYLGHEPQGRGNQQGEWSFRTQSGRQVFVEVKTFAEPERTATGVYSRPDYRPRVRSEVRRAYSQLPRDGQATLLILVGTEIPKISFGLMHGSIFEAIYGQFQVRLNVGAHEPVITSAGPSFRDMAIHSAKHRRLSCIAGLCKMGHDTPVLDFYFIQNPYAYPELRIPDSDLGNSHRFVVDKNGTGTDIDGVPHDEFWKLLARPYVC